MKTIYKYKPKGASVVVVVCTHLSGKELHTQVGLDRVIASGSLGGVMVITLVQSGKKCGFESCSRHNFLPFSSPHNLDCHDADPVKAMSLTFLMFLMSLTSLIFPHL